MDTRPLIERFVKLENTELLQKLNEIQVQITNSTELMTRHLQDLQKRFEEVEKAAVRWQLLEEELIKQENTRERKPEGIDFTPALP